jgi:hypothetical protein
LYQGVICSRLPLQRGVRAGHQAWGRPGAARHCHKLQQRTGDNRPPPHLTRPHTTP